MPINALQYDKLALIDTSAVIALFDPTDRFHKDATILFDSAADLVWFTLNATTHETFTRVRYRNGLHAALMRFNFLRSDPFHLLAFNEEDEHNARDLLKKYSDQTVSFHDALCAVTMHRAGIYKVFSFDSDFWTLGFEVMPGRTR
jgi:uncharacterized protein